MKLKIILFIIYTTITQYGYAQVTNRALCLNGKGKVVFTPHEKLSLNKNHTFQFWMKVSRWVTDAHIIRCGEKEDSYTITLGEKDCLYLKSDKKTHYIPAEIVKAGDWVHVSILNGEKELRVLLNNKPSYKSPEPLRISESFQKITIGEKFCGEIDELRVWNACLTDEIPVLNDIFLMWRNTVNKHHPNYQDLMLYAKFDEQQYQHITDYTRHMSGSIEGSGIESKVVSDNTNFQYKKIAGYLTFDRWANGNIDKEKFLLVNDLIVMCLKMEPDGSVTPVYKENEGSANNGTYLKQYKGRNGVLSLNGEQSWWNGGTEALENSAAFSFGTWLYLDKWNKGAFLIRKKDKQGKEFFIRFAKFPYLECRTKDSKTYTVKSTLSIGKWQHLALSIQDDSKFILAVNGENNSPVPLNSNLKSESILARNDTSCLIGIGISGKLDETWITHHFKNLDKISQVYKNGIIFPDEKHKIELEEFSTNHACWMYNNPQQPGFDSYSFLHYVDLIRQNYKGYQGFQVRAAVFAFAGWQEAIQNLEIRARYAEQISKYAPYFDGFDLDLEWCKCSDCWDDYGKLIIAIKSKLPANKTLSISPHSTAYELPQKYMPYVDRFNLQMYGPLKNEWQWKNFMAGGKRVKDWGYPLDKMILSFATTTSRAYHIDTDEKAEGAPTGFRYLSQLPGFDLKKDFIIDAKGYKRYITSAYQVVKRCEWIRDHNYGGIMFWEIAQDIPTAHPDNVIKHASFSMNSNVDPLHIPINK